MTLRSFTITRDSYTGRIRVRCASSRIDEMAAKAAETGQPRWRVADGGGVCNSYGYPAQTEAITEVVFPPHPRTGIQLGILYLAQMPANKCTHSGAIAHCVGHRYRPLTDARYGDAATQVAQQALFCRARADIGYLQGGAEAERRRRNRAALRDTPQPLSLRQRLLVRLSSRLTGLSQVQAERDVRDANLWFAGRWLMAEVKYTQRPIAYRPHGDERDVAAFQAEQNQQRRRLIFNTCGERVLALTSMTLIHQDEYGALYDTRIETGRWNETVHVVRVVCPSTGAVYLLPCSPDASTAHEAVASTFGLRADEYCPTAQA